MADTTGVVAIVLAAGSASRFGSAKALALLEGRPLLQHVLDSLAAAEVRWVIVVLGAAAADVEAAIDWRQERRVLNPNPERGLASSLQVGLDAVPPDAEAALVVLGDQPRLRPDVVEAVVAAGRASDRPITIARYDADGALNPVLLGRAAFPLAFGLSGDRGMGSLIHRSPELVTEVHAGGDNPDVDTPADLARLVESGRGEGERMSSIAGSRDLEIDRVRVMAVAPPDTTAAWAEGMPPQIATYTIVRLETRGGLVGVAGTASYTPNEPDLSIAETLRPFAHTVLGRSAADPAAIWPVLRVDLPVAPQALSLIDIAMWDAAAQSAELPLHRHLGSARDRLPAYASTPMLHDIPAYLDHVDELRARGYRAIKFHCWCQIERDLELARAVRAVHPGSEVRLMLDVEQRYSPADALRAARELGDLDFDWFEAPLDDFDLAGYAALRSAVSIPILPAGNWIVDERLIAIGIAMGAWSRVRVDVTVCGGITPALRILERARAAGLLLEFQSWGYSLASTANLQVALAGGLTTYFEQAVPESGYEFAATNPPRVDRDGDVRAPLEPGLGLVMDWPAIERAAVAGYEVRA